jgi:hypothetical protein
VETRGEQPPDPEQKEWSWLDEVSFSTKLVLFITFAAVLGYAVIVIAELFI